MSKDNMTTKFLTVLPTEAGLDFILGNGKKVTFDAGKVSAEIAAQAQRHGFNQKIRDSSAGFSKTSDFSGAFAAMADVVQSLYDGDWNRKGGGTGQKMEDLAAAIAKVKNVSVDVARAAVMKAAPEKRKEWLGNAKVGQLVKAMEAARLKEAAKDAEDIEIDLS